MNGKTELQFLLIKFLSLSSSCKKAADLLERGLFIFAHLLAERHLELGHFEMLRMATTLVHADVENERREFRRRRCDRRFQIINVNIINGRLMARGQRNAELEILREAMAESNRVRVAAQKRPKRQREI